jgi:hypothetical protein
MAFDGEMEAIANIMDYVNDHEIAGGLTIYSDAQGTIALVGHTGTGPGQDRVIRVVKAVQRPHQREWQTCIEWVPGDTGIKGNERADQLAGDAGSHTHKGRTFTLLMLSNFNILLSDKHMSATKRVLHYLGLTMKLGLRYYKMVILNFIPIPTRAILITGVNNNT